MSEQNKLTDLNDYLFEQMKKLSDPKLSKDEVLLEIQKAEAMTNVADTIIKNGELTLKTAVVMARMNGDNTPKIPQMLSGGGGED